MLRDGKWMGKWDPVHAKDKDGRWQRETASFRRWITADGGAGPEGQEALPAEVGRYHLFVAYICPWACRTLMVRALKGLDDVISVSILEPVLSDEGWRFGDFDGATGPDTQIGAQYMHQIYTHTDPHFTGRATVPVLWDKKTKTIVNNESADIICILNTAFNDITGNTLDLRPEALAPEMDAFTKVMYNQFNNGVYKSGFAQSQIAYDEAVTGVFEFLEQLEARFADGRAYVMGDALTEADIRLFVTLIRFDAAYVGLFKCNLKRIADYAYIQPYLERLYALEGVKDTVRMDHIKAGYYSVKALNPTGIVPKGPDLAFTA